MASASRERVEIIVAVVGACQLSATQATIFEADIAHLFKALKRHYPHSPVQILTPLASTAERMAARRALAEGFAVVAFGGAEDHAASDLAGVQFLPDEFLAKAGTDDVDEAVAELLCRYAHILAVFVDPHSSEEPESRRATITREKWETRTFSWGDQEGEDTAELLVQPTNGPVIELDARCEALASREAKARRRVPANLRIWRLHSDARAPADFSIFGRAKTDALKELDRLNKDLDWAQPLRAAHCAATLLPPEALAEIHTAMQNQGVDGQGRQALLDDIAELGGIFGRADAYAIHAKKAILRPVSIFLAASLPLSVLWYEAMVYPEWGAWRIGVAGYCLIVALTLVAGYMLARSDQQDRLYNARLVAEVLRVLIWWRIAGVEARLESTMRRWLPNELLSVQLCARAFDFRAARRRLDHGNLTQVTHEHWVGPPLVAAASGAGSAYTQSIWYTQASASHRRSAQAMNWRQTAVFALAFGLSLAASAFGLISPTLPSWLGMALPVAISVLPATAGAVALFREREGHAFFAESYARMARVAGRVSQRLNELPAADVEKRRHALKQLGREVIGEGIDWLLAHRLRRLTPVAG